MRALLFGVDIRAPEFGNALMEPRTSNVGSILCLHGVCLRGQHEESTFLVSPKDIDPKKATLAVGAYLYIYICIYTDMHIYI